jgi:hypothetical protein
MVLTTKEGVTMARLALRTALNSESEIDLYAELEEYRSFDLRNLDLEILGENTYLVTLIASDLASFIVLLESQEDTYAADILESLKMIEIIED